MGADLSWIGIVVCIVPFQAEKPLQYKGFLPSIRRHVNLKGERNGYRATMAATNDQYPRHHTQAARVYVDDCGATKA